MNDVLNIINETNNNIFDFYEESRNVNYFANKKYKISAPKLVYINTDEENTRSKDIQNKGEKTNQELLNELDSVLKINNT